MKKTVAVTGMTCAACSARVEKVTKAVSGVHSAEVNLPLLNNKVDSLAYEYRHVKCERYRNKRK